MAATRPKHSMLDPSNGGTAVDSAAAGPSGGLASAVPRRSAGWRADIDGLRAVGVLAVIVFHLRKRWLPGGFAGVDVFFVISGFLITRAIVEDLSAGVFSRTEFYRRRVKRISLPMLAVVLATVAFAQVALLPKDALATAWSGVAAVLCCISGRSGWRSSSICSGPGWCRGSSGDAGPRTGARRASPRTSKMSRRDGMPRRRRFRQGAWR